jgi:hypothetical protein
VPVQVNGDSPDPVGDFNAINQELALFNPVLAQKPQVGLSWSPTPWSRACIHRIAG